MVGPIFPKPFRSPTLPGRHENPSPESVLAVKSNLILGANVRIVPAMSRHLFPILAAVVLLTASAAADDKLDQLRKDAETGKAQAQYDLGVMYSFGQGVEKDFAEAVKWYRKAAEQGHATAQHNLGVMYQDGQGVEKDYAKALKWYRKAADQGKASAQCNLGLMFAKGYGVEKDYVDAYAWFNLGAANGNEKAGENRNTLEKQMSPQQIADAQKRTKELKKLIADKQKSDAPKKTDSD